MMLLDKSIHIGILGTTGSGKDMLGEQLLETDYLKEGRKIIDLQNNKYIEGVGFLKQSKFPHFNKWFKTNAPNIKRPDGFPTEIWHPIVDPKSVEFPNRLPPCIKLYSIPLEFFTHENVLKILTNDSLTDSSYTALTEEIKKLSKMDSMPMLPYKIMETVDKEFIRTMGAGNVPLHFRSDTKKSSIGANRPILKFKELGIFSSEKFEHSLTDKKIKDMLLDKKTITVFTTRWIPEKFKKLKLAINYWLYYKIREIGQKIGGGITLYVREAHQIYPNPKFTSDKGLRVLGEQAEDDIKDCRKADIRIKLNTQNPKSIQEGVLAECSTLFLFRHNINESVLFENYRNLTGLDDERIRNLRKLPLHHFYVAGLGAKIQYNPVRGNRVLWRFTDHLEAGTDELNYIKEIFPKEEWYDIKPYFDALREDWWQSHKKVERKVNILFKFQEERLKAKSVGININDKIVLELMYSQKTIRNIEFMAMKEIEGLTAMRHGTLGDALSRLANKGFLGQNEESEYTLTRLAIDFIESNPEVFNLKPLEESLEESNPEQDGSATPSMALSIDH